MEAPTTRAEAASFLREAAAAGRSVAFRGGGTKLAWRRGPEPDVWLSTRGLARLVEHNAGDLTAVLEAGMPLAEAQAAFRSAGQRLALDPPLGPGESATVGGVVAAADSGPLRHRYGAPRDFLLGLTAALPDGTLARSGGKVIKNVAGYDLAKLFAGSAGTLGLVVEVVVRLHPLPRETATIVAESADPHALGRAALALAAAPLELEALDVLWEGGAGAILAQVAGTAVSARAPKVAALAAAEGLEARVVEDDDGLWTRQREAQRSPAGAVVRVAALPTALAEVVRAVDDAGGSVVGRAGVGTFWAALPARAEIVEAFRARVAPAPSVVLDAPGGLAAALAPEQRDAAVRRLEARVRARFDPAGILRGAA